MHLLAGRITLFRTWPTNRGHDARGWLGKPHVRSFTRLVGLCTARTLTPVLGVFCLRLRYSSTTVTHAPRFVKTDVCRPTDSGTVTTTRRAI